METVGVQLQVPKETKEVIDLLDAIVEKAKSGADLNEYTTLLPQLMTALDGVQKVGAEMQGQYRDEAAAYLLQKILSRLAPAEGGEPLPEVTG